MKLVKPSAAFVVSALFSLQVSAEELRVVDCGGNTLALKNISTNTTQDVQIVMDGGLVPTSNAAELTTLSSKVTGEKITALATNTGVSFSKVASGSWMLCPIPQGLAVREVVISSPARGNSASSLVLGALALGGAAVAGVSIADDDSSSESFNGPAVTTVSSTSNTAPAATKPQNSQSNTPSSNNPVTISADDDEDCRTGDKPQGISPFS